MSNLSPPPRPRGSVNSRIDAIEGRMSGVEGATGRLTSIVEKMEKHGEVLEGRVNGVEGELKLIRSENEKQTGHLSKLVDAFGHSPDVVTGKPGTGLCGTLANLEDDRRNRVRRDNDREAVRETTRKTSERRRAWAAWAFGGIGAIATVTALVAHFLHIF